MRRESKRQLSIVQAPSRRIGRVHKATRAEGRARRAALLDLLQRKGEPLYLREVVGLARACPGYRSCVASDFVKAVKYDLRELRAARKVALHQARANCKSTWSVVEEKT